MGIGDGDWGLGIGDWAQSPIPNPQSPKNYLMLYCLLLIISHNYETIKNNYYY